MGYDRGDSFPFDFEQNGIQFCSKLKGKLSLRSYPIQCERKWKHSSSSLSVIIMTSGIALINKGTAYEQNIREGEEKKKIQ